ncbi:MAG: FG-GAP repeat protein [Ignavibacteria bacterium]|nr:FG-GAP repeat protein [Ignavibacteria bacterium]
MNTKEGMRQDFIIKEKPEGNGKLRLNMSVDTKLKMIVGSDALMFKSNDGNEKMKYSQLKCWDAEGKELRAYFEKNSISPNTTSNSGFSIVVNDDNATYPITIDPLSSPDWTAEGNQNYAQLECVASAGDVNGDSYGDVIIGVSRFDNDLSTEGRVYVYHGSPAGLSLLQTGLPKEIRKVHSLEPEYLPPGMQMVTDTRT